VTSSAVRSGSAATRGIGRRAFAVLLWAVALTGCVSVSVGAGDAPALVYYKLGDARPAQAAKSAADGGFRLAIQSTGGDPVADATQIPYSRRQAERSFYQFAAWTERPSRRLAQLAQSRLEASGRFAVVAQLGQPIAADWLLTLSLESLVHDVGTTPGHARLALRAELIRRDDRIRVGQRLFTAEAPVGEANAPAAVAAFDVAVADLLDQLTAWTVSTLAAQPTR
jgi:ABC-type uncharacterized transport system auxiliary subunit